MFEVIENLREQTDLEGIWYYSDEYMGYSKNIVATAFTEPTCEEQAQYDVDNAIYRITDISPNSNETYNVTFKLSGVRY